jgi:hypothetical protein
MENIEISQETKDLLDVLKGENETYDELIYRLI